MCSARAWPQAVQPALEAMQKSDKAPHPQLGMDTGKILQLKDSNPDACSAAGCLKQGRRAACLGMETTRCLQLCTY